MSDVEQYWEAIRKRWPHPTPSYQQLDPMEQMMLVQSVNILLQILNSFMLSLKMLSITCTYMNN